MPSNLRARCIINEAACATVANGLESNEGRNDVIVRRKTWTWGRWCWFAALGGCGGELADPSADAGRRRDSGTSIDVDAAPVEDSRIFIDDVCADTAKTPPQLACDPFAAAPCTAGKGCYAVPPRATGICQPGSYGTICSAEGRARQGETCNDTTECIGSFVCVKSGIGNHCAKLCKVSVLGSCEGGRVCRVLDLSGSGWGACD